MKLGSLPIVGVLTGVLWSVALAAGQTLDPRPTRDRPELVNPLPGAQPDRPDPVDPVDAPAPPAASQPADPKLAVKIEQLTVYYMGLFEPCLKNADWITRAIAVISLARLDDPRTTDTLLTVAEKDANPVVRVYAWEALHARNPSLTDAQRGRWTAAGCKLASTDALKADLRVGFIQLIGASALTPETQKAFVYLFHHTSLQAVADEQVLLAMRKAVATWHDPAIIRALVDAMATLDNAHRADFLLSGLDSGIPSGRMLEMNTEQTQTTIGGVKWMTIERKGSKAAWQQTSAAWKKWLDDPKTAPKAAGDLAPYMGRSLVIPAPHKVLNPNDPMWRKDLEIPRFQLERFDLCFVVDSTDSMGPMIEWVKKNVVRVMWAMQAISREPRMAVTLYRDHSTPTSKEEYLVRTTPLMADGKRLADAIMSASASGGGDIPEAVYEALQETLTKLDWSPGANIKKVVLLVGDAPPHAETMDRIHKMVAGAAEKGFRFCCVKVGGPSRTVPDPQEFAGKPCDLDTSFDMIAEWGKAESIAVDASQFRYEYSSRLAFRGVDPRMDAGLDPREVRPWQEPDASKLNVGLTDASDPYCTAKNNDPYNRIVGGVMRNLLKEAYQDRVPAFVNVLLELVAPPSEPEKHQVLEPLSQKIQLRDMPVDPVMPNPVPPAQPARTSETIYYLSGNGTLGMVNYLTNPRQAVSAQVLSLYQGQMRWSVAQVADVARGKEIPQEQAMRMMQELMSGRKPGPN